MPSRSLMQINLMQAADIAVVPAAGYVSEKVTVRWYMTTGDVYKQGSKQDDNGNWIDVYAPSKIGLSKLFTAGGIRETSSETVRHGTEWIWSSKWSGTYTTPGGIEIPLSGTYEYDVTKGGGRWCEKRNSQIDYLIKKHSNNWRLNKEGLARAKATLPQETLDEFTKLAEIAADEYVEHEAMYGAQRAETGAILRPIRMLFGIRSDYTQEEIENSEFVIYRTRMDMAAMQEHLGPLGAGAANFIALLKSTGVEPQQIAALAGQFIEAQKDMLMIEGQVVKRDETDPFNESMYRTTFNAIRRAMFKIWPEKEAITNDEVSTKMVEIFGEKNGNLPGCHDPWSILSEGDGQVALAFYEEMTKYTSDPEEFKKKRAHFLEIARQCIAQKIPFSPDMKIKQSTLDDAEHHDIELEGSND